MMTSEHNSSALILHPKIYLDAQGHITHALRIESGRITAIGHEATGIPAHHTITPEADCLFPALADAHIHLWDLGMRVGLVDLKGSGSPDEVMQRLAAREVLHPPSGWIQGHGWDQHAWEKGKALSLDALDALFPDTPVCLYRVDYHAGFVNSAALKIAELGAHSLIEGGHVELDAQGRPTGLLVDEALNRLTSHIPPESQHELEQVYREKAAMLRAYGIASAHMAWTQRNGLRMVRALHERGELPIRTFCMIDANDPELDTILAEGPVDDPEAWLSMSCIKFFADGAMGSRGALMLEPYLDGTSGFAVTSRERLLEEIPALVERGWHVATHAIGDAAARHVLDAYALARQRSPERLLRLEHAQTMHPHDIERMHELDVIASVQPIHMYSDSPWAADVVQAHQLERLYNWRQLERATLLCGGSDYPIDDPNPWHGIATFVSRRNASGESWRPEQAISRLQALDAYTAGAARAAGWGARLGQLYPGFVAEILALPRDPFHCSINELWEMTAEWVTS